jgi:cellulose synthase/poly-beta-1,6-N-acetylglucosamine synthase-like glycosyltransferase
VIIDITRCAFQRGYLPRKENTIFHPFFATNNAAFRRAALEKAGEFDPLCRTGEDIDMSIRVAKAGYELWYEPSARIQHLDRRTFGGLVRQWFGYGAGHPYLFRKHVPGPRLRFYRFTVPGTPSEPLGVSCLLDLPFPIHSLVFLSSFHVLHLGPAAALACALLGATTAALAIALAALLAGVMYFSVRFQWRHPLRSAVLAGIRYSVDAAFTLGAFLAGLRQGVIYLEAARSRRPVSRKS